MNSLFGLFKKRKPVELQVPREAAFKQLHAAFAKQEKKKKHLLLQLDEITQLLRVAVLAHNMTEGKLLLQRKKLVVKNLEFSSKTLQSLEQQISLIQTAEAATDLINTTKQTNEAIKEITSDITSEDINEIIAETESQKELTNELQDFFIQSTDEGLYSNEEIEKELEQLQSNIELSELKFPVPEYPTESTVTTVPPAEVVTSSPHRKHRHKHRHRHKSKQKNDKEGKQDEGAPAVKVAFHPRTYIPL